MAWLPASGGTARSTLSADVGRSAPVCPWPRRVSAVGAIIVHAGFSPGLLQFSRDFATLILVVDSISYPEFSDVAPRSGTVFENARQCGR